MELSKLSKSEKSDYLLKSKLFNEPLIAELRAQHTLVVKQLLNLNSFVNAEEFQTRYTHLQTEKDKLTEILSFIDPEAQNG